MAQAVNTKNVVNTTENNCKHRSKLKDLSIHATPKYSKENTTYYLSRCERTYRKITNICYKHQLNIVQNNEFVDHRTGRFFMRTELEGIFNDETF